jgi:hypothetical protein
MALRLLSYSKVFTPEVFMNAPVTPAAGAAGTGPSLDELIFIELCGRALQCSDAAATVKPDAAVLAKLSLQLADAYRSAHKEKMADLMPKNVGYEIQMDDLANWDKKK